MAEKKKRRKKIGKPDPLLYYGAHLLAGPYYRLKYGITVDNRALKGIKGPALILCPHISNMDHITVSIGLFQHRPTYLLSEHFMLKPLNRFLLSKMGVITKRMFSTDTASVLNILRAVKEKNLIVIFPEGRLTWYGHSLQVTEGSYELIQKLNIDVYTVTGNGAYLTNPKWNDKKRRGKIHIVAEKIFEAGEGKSLPPAEIKRRLDAAILHDDEEAMKGVRYRIKDTTKGLDGILWYCPNCGGIHTLKTEKCHITCGKCGMDAIMDEYYRISGAPVSSVNEWYRLCASTVRTDIPFESHGTLGSNDLETGNLVKNIGEGILKMDSGGTHFEGVFEEEQIHFDYTPKELPAFPIAVADHIDIYHQNRALYFYPDDPRDAIRFVAYLDKLTEEMRTVPEN